MSELNNNTQAKEMVGNVNNSLFDYINPNDNDSFSKMNRIDLQTLLCCIKHYYLELRDRLGFGKNITFGLELEFEYAMRKRIENQLKEMYLARSWPLVDDNSLNEGGEINSSMLEIRVTLGLH